MSMRLVKRFGVVCVTGVLLAGAVASQPEEMPDFPKPVKEHAWLQQLAGEWTSEVNMTMGEGAPEVKSEGTETVRSVGGFWIIAENNGDMMGMPFTGVLTLGYDPDKSKFVGTWIDSMTSYMWNYVGTLDAAGKVLTLETEGPSPERPGETCKFRETIELRSPDEKVFSSSMQSTDGSWTQMLTINYRRK